MQSEFYANIQLEYRWADYLYLRLSAEAGSFGEILDIGLNSVDLLDFRTADLVGESMSQLIPEFYRAYHE